MQRSACLKFCVSRYVIVVMTTAMAACACFAQTANVLTFHNDVARSGQNLREGILSPANVTVSDFGKLFTVAMDGKVDAEPLYVSALTIAGHRHNVVIAATEHDSVYAFDGDTGSVYWHVSMLRAGETTSDDRNCNQVIPEIGVTATPVIDPSSGPHGTAYVVAMSKDGHGNYYHRLHALDLSTGAEEFGGPVTVQASYPGNGSANSFDAKQYKDRPGLLLLNGVVYTSFGSHCDSEPYAGWSIGYNEKTLQQASVFNFAPNGGAAAPWNSGGAPAADADGNIYYSLANGTFDTTLNPQGFPAKGDYGNALVKLAPAGSSFEVKDYWTMDNSVTESAGDVDLGSGGLVLLPDFTDSTGKVRQLVAAAGKDGNLYVADRNNMGKFNPGSNANLYQELPGVLPGGMWGNPAYFNGIVYFGPADSEIRAFPVKNARLSSQPSSTTEDSYVYPGANPSISSYNGGSAILWAISSSSPAGLYAYNPYNLAVKYYDSTQAANGRDNFGAGNKFMVPTIANGKVFVGTPNSVAVFGLLHKTSAPLADGVYTLTNQYSGFAMDDYRSTPSPGTWIIQWPLTGGLNQSWFFANQGNGYYTIQNASSGLYLSDPSGARSTGTALAQQWRFYDDSQLWSMVASGPGYSIQNKATGMVIDDAGYSSTEGTTLILWPLKAANARTNQVWLIR